MTRARRLRDMLLSPGLNFLMEAHNALSGRIAEEAGFPGLWASGLSIAAQFGVRDSNEASWTQVVDLVEFMADATTIPILLDGDTGYGNFNNFRRLVRKLEQRQVAGVCIEDKLFPKTNSFIAGERQQLADVDEFCGKIKAGKDSQLDPDFCLVARVEALIAGLGMAEALRRAEAYRAAGADAILIHSSRSRADEIVAFAREWAGRGPLVIVPTQYYSTPVEVYRKAGISLAIWANHLLRASVAAMQATAREIQASCGPADVEDRIAPVAEVFRLQGAAELQEAEARYAVRAGRPRAVVLAASRGQELESLTAARPKAMVPIGGKPLLGRLVEELRQQGIQDIAVVVGYRADSVDLPGVTLVENPAHASSGELASLAAAQEHLGEDCLLLYGDLLFRSYVLRDFLDCPGECAVVVDSSPQNAVSGAPDYARCSQSDDRSLFEPEIRLLGLSRQRDQGPHGRWIGMARLRSVRLAEALRRLGAREDFAHLEVGDLLNDLVAQGVPVAVHYIHGHWLDVNHLDDLERAERFTR